MLTLIQRELDSCLRLFLHRSLWKAIEIIESWSKLKTFVKSLVFRVIKSRIRKLMCLNTLINLNIAWKTVLQGLEKSWSCPKSMLRYQGWLSTGTFENAIKFTRKIRQSSWTATLRTSTKLNEDSLAITRRRRIT